MSDGSLILEDHLNDWVPDCEHQSDELRLQALLENNIHYGCININQLPCKPGHSACYNLSNICIFFLDENDILFPCRNGGHLENCSFVECSGTFKCFSSYCIPWGHVCDGNVDCPFGDDENYKFICGTGLICENMFKCKETPVKCIHLSSICDKRNDCSFADDEALCLLFYLKCPKSCLCLALAISCNKTLSFELSLLEKFMFIKLQEFPLFTSVKFLFKEHSNILVVKMRQNNISTLCHVTFPHTVQHITAEENQLSILSKNCFDGLEKLRILNLPNNSISQIHTSAFSNLTSLILISLKLNPVATIRSTIFGHLCRIKVLQLQLKCLPDIHIDAMKTVPDTIHILTSDFRFCCILPGSSYCSSRAKWHVSCDWLLPTTTLFILFVVVSFLILTLNILSAALQKTTHKKTQASSIMVIFVNASELLLTVYLKIVWITHLILNKQFFNFQERWKSHNICVTAATAILGFLILNQILLLLLSIGRSRIVVKPVDTRFKKTSFVFKAFLSCCGLSVMISVGIMTTFSLTVGRLPLNLCLPVVDPDESYFISALIYLISSMQFVLSIVIVIIYCHLVYHKYQSGKRVSSTSQLKTSDTAMIVQFIIICFSNFLSWYPTNIIYILGMVSESFSIKVLIWTTVVGTPLNSVVNPSVFVIFCLKGYIRDKPTTK